MRWNNRESWPRSAREGIAALESRSIPLPDEVIAAVAVLDRVEAGQPVRPDQTAIRRAIIDGATTDTINALLLADLAADRLGIEWNQARVESAGAVLTAILETADRIIPALREQAEELIAKLRTVAEFNGAGLDDLVRAGRTDDSRLLADVNLVAAELDNVYGIRDRYLTPGGPQQLTVNGINASKWVDPIGAAHRANGANAADRYVRGLAAGLELHYPTPPEAIKLAQQIADTEALEAARVRAQQHGAGSVAAFS